MIVRCQQCGTEFGFDDTQIGDGITVRCSVCKNVFKVESASARAPGWQIRTTEDTSFTAPDVATMRQWIDEGRLHPDDQVSRTGQNWVRLGNMPEFSAAFVRFGAIAPVVKPVAPPAPAPPPAARPAPPPAAGPKPPSARAPLSPPRSAPPPPVDIESLNLNMNVRPDPEPDDLGISRASLNEVDEPEAARSWSGEFIKVDDDEPGADAPTRVRRREAKRAASKRSARGDELSLELADDDAPPRPAKKRPPRADGPELQLADDDAPRRAAKKRPNRADGPAIELDFDDDDRSAPRDQLAAFEPAKRRGVGPGLIAFLGVIAAVGVMFGVPQIREKLLNLGRGQQEAPAQATARPEVAAAERATRRLGMADLAKAEAELQRAIDAGDADAPTQASMELALADLLISRALAYEIAAAIDPDQREDFRRRASEDQEDGERLVDGLEGATDIDRLAEVRAFARLASGRTEAEVLPQVPEAATETALVVRAAVLWQDLDAPVPQGLVGGLQGVAPPRTGLGDSALALALLRAGDETAARNAAERLLVVAPDQIVALTIRSRLGPGDADAGEDGAGEGETGAPAEGGDGDDPGVAKAPPPPDGGDGGGGSGGGGGGGGGGGSSFDRLLERGCKQVSSGDAAGGIKTLLKAFDRQPKNIDVLVCLAEGYAAQGNNGRADQFFDRALQQSPKSKFALRGAAKVAAKTGATARATELYERLLKVDPNNAAAKAYLGKNKPSQPEPKPDPTPAPEPTPPADTGG